MAELGSLAVSSALFLSEFVPALLDELNLRDDVLKEIKKMESWLSFMKAFMEENYGREGGKMLDHHVVKVRDIAYDIEDVLDEFVLHSPRYTFHNHSITRKVHGAAHNVYHRFPIHGILKKMENINGNIDDFKSQTASSFPYNRHSDPRPSSSSKTRNGLPASPLLLDDEMIGYEVPKDGFNRRLVDGEKRLVKLAVTGTAGAGKTTFVKNVFWKRRVWGQFDCHAWVYVSREFNLEELFRNMLKQLCFSRKEAYPADDGSNTITKLHKYLSGKKYIIVLDNICSKEDWDYIKDALPDAFCGSRIIITTSLSDVASICASSDNHIYSLNGLEWLQGLKLFFKNAFPELNGQCPSELKDCSVRIVTRCEGLPLAIITIGRALAKKSRIPEEWERFHNSLEREIRTDPNLFVLRNALMPDYMDLSSNLKSCLLCLSIFPEDYSVKRGRLVRLWVAEGFAAKTDDQTAEEVAEEYLNELVHRHLVDVSSWDFDGRPRSFRVSNLFLNFIIQKCKEENFVSIFPRENASQSQKIRRLSVHDDWNHLPQNTDIGGVRSMFLLRLLNISPDFEERFRAVRFLKTLDFQGVRLTEFPKYIGRLTLLKYINLSDTLIKVIPKSIKNLSCLETLNLKQTDVTKLPKEISYLHNIHHLLAYKKNVKNFVYFESVQSVELSSGISNLTNLQKLSLVKVDEQGRLLRDLEKFTQLRKLGLTGLKCEHGKDLSASLGHMKNLITLDLCSTNKEEYLELGDMSYLRPHDTLQRLYLKGRLRKLPSSISSLGNLIRIRLKWSKMQRSPLKALGRLPNLMELQLVDCYDGKELIFEAWCFEKLKILMIEEFTELQMIKIETGATRGLKEISIRRCPNLMLCPLGIDKLVEVQEMTLYDMAEELIARLRMNSEDRAMVEHIPVVHSFTLKNQCWVKENLSGSFSQ